MGCFFFDESIHPRAGFILGGWVYARRDLSQEVHSAIAAAGLRRRIDEFKSSARMDEDEGQRLLRDNLKGILQSTRLGLIVCSIQERPRLGNEALRGLAKIVRANRLDGEPHDAFLDEGISFEKRGEAIAAAELDLSCRIHCDQDSRLVPGLQLADLAAHTMSIMLLETLGLVGKTVKAGDASGYDPDLHIELGFEMWATIRYQFFTQDEPNLEVDGLEGFTLDIGSYALHVSDGCPEPLRAAAVDRFGTCYMGCIH